MNANTAIYVTGLILPMLVSSALAGAAQDLLASDSQSEVAVS